MLLFPDVELALEATFCWAAEEPVGTRESWFALAVVEDRDRDGASGPPFGSAEPAAALPSPAPFCVPAPPLPLACVPAGEPAAGGGPGSCCPPPPGAAAPAPPPPAACDGAPPELPLPPFCAAAAAFLLAFLSFEAELPIEGESAAQARALTRRVGQSSSGDAGRRAGALVTSVGGVRGQAAGERAVQLSVCERACVAVAGVERTAARGQCSSDYS